MQDTSTAKTRDHVKIAMQDTFTAKTRGHVKIAMQDTLLSLAKLTAPMDAFLSNSQTKPKASKLSQRTMQTWPCNAQQRTRQIKTTIHAKTNMQAQCKHSWLANLSSM